MDQDLRVYLTDFTYVFEYLVVTLMIHARSDVPSCNFFSEYTVKWV